MARILVVDDSPFMVRLVTYMLETAGYETVSAENGRAALDVIASDPPDLVFLDTMMPEMDGLETLRAIRSNPVTEGLPVLMLTAKVQAEDHRVAKEAGADGYLTKPFNQAEVLDSVVEYLKRAPGSPPQRGGDEGRNRQTTGEIEVVHCQGDLAAQDARVGLPGCHDEDACSGLPG